MAKCDNCAHQKMRQGVCPIFQTDMTGQNGCPQFTEEIITCDICGAAVINNVILDEDNNGDWHYMCYSCYNSPKCTSCIHTYCAFASDQECKEPHFVMVRRQQGNMMVQSQQMNPKRIEATCRKGCPCFQEDGLDDGTFCGRKCEWGCDKHRIKWRNEK